MFFDLLALGVELALVVEVLVLLRIFHLAELAPERELVAAEAGERRFLGAQRLVQGLLARLELRLRLGREVRLELFAALGERALELAGMALDRLPAQAFGEGEAVAALRAGDLLVGGNDDRARHVFLLNCAGCGGSGGRR